MIKHFPGSASLFEDLGKCLLIKLRGGHVYIGCLKMVDQFGNIALHNTIERIYVKDKFCDIHRGIMLIRGDSIIIIGEMKPDYSPEEHFERVSEDEIKRLKAEEILARRQARRKRSELLASRGILIPELPDIFDDL